MELLWHEHDYKMCPYYIHIDLNIDNLLSYIYDI